MGQLLVFETNSFFFKGVVVNAKFQQVSSQLFHNKTLESHPGKSLLDGKFPSQDQFGNPLRGSRGLKAGKSIAQGWRGAFESWAGDWKERSLSHQFLQRNYQSTRVCDQCSAIKPFAATPPELLPFIYTDFRLNAPWTTTIRTHDDYLRETPAMNISPWVDVPGFIINRVKWDSAHTILLGTGKDLAASFLYDMVFCLDLVYFAMIHGSGMLQKLNIGYHTHV